jgi:dTDP-4-amino-4,6-dideoxyglucose
VAIESDRRDAIYDALRNEDILARKYFNPPCHLAGLGKAVQGLPVTERLAREVLVLPTGPNVSFKDIERVCTIIRKVT